MQEEVRCRRQVCEGSGFNCGESEDEGKAEEEDGRWQQKVLFNKVMGTKMSDLKVPIYEIPI